MFCTSGAQVLWVDALPIVSNAQANLACSIRDLRLDVNGLCVTERIAQRFARNAVDIVAKDRMQVARRPLDGRAERRRAPLAVRSASEIFGQRRHRLSQFVDDGCGGPEILNRVAAFDDGLIRPSE